MKRWIVDEYGMPAMPFYITTQVLALLAGFGIGWFFIN